MGTIMPVRVGLYPTSQSRLQKANLSASPVEALKERAATTSAPTVQPALSTQIDRLIREKQPPANLGDEGAILAIVDDYQGSGIPAFAKKRSLLGRLMMESPTNGFVSHGHIVEAHARMSTPDINIYRVQVPYHTRLGQTFFDVRTALRGLKQDLDTGKPIDAVNLSFGLSIPLERIRKDLKIPELTAENLPLYRDTILKEMKNIKLDTLPELSGLGFLKRGQKTYLQDTIALLEQIAQKTPIYLSAGNDGINYVNLFSLAKGVTTVGATGTESGATEYSGKNGLVQKWAQATRRLLPIKTRDGQLAGFALTRDNHPKRFAYTTNRRVLIPADALKMRWWGRWWAGLKGAFVVNCALSGTSFAAPQVAARQAQRFHRLRQLLGMKQSQKQIRAALPKLEQTPPNRQ